MKTNEILKHLLRQHGISQDIAAAKIGCSRITMNRFLNGKSDLGHKSFSSFCQLFGVNVDQQLIRLLAKRDYSGLPGGFGSEKTPSA